ncbi:MAG TPA: arginyltransferase [Desulfuromonadales bacterium]|jgi:arginine-tRNA-protein transferase
MQVLKSPQLEELAPCPYLPERRKQYEYFLATRLSTAEVASCFESGWRKFGPYYFRPACPDCRQCIPLRVPVTELVHSRSQRRVLRRNADLRVTFGPLRPSEVIYNLYRQHSGNRFGRETDPEEFLFHFYLPSCPTLQTEIHLGDELAGIGFLDVGADCLSSVYFCFDPRFAGRSLGIFSVLQEIEHARRLGLSYYYLGYYVPGCPIMDYKDHFRAREHFDWDRRQWRRCSEPPGFLSTNQSDRLGLGQVDGGPDNTPV